MSDKKTDAELVHMLQVYQETKSLIKAGNVLGMAPQNLSRHVANAKSKGLTANTKIVDPLAAAKVEIKILERKLAEQQVEADTAASIRETIYGLGADPTPPPKWLIDKKGLDNTPGIPVALWSDWHLGEVVLPDETGGLNKFNSEIAAERVRRLATRTIKLAKKQVPDAQGIVVCLGGDMISGDIHEELVATNDLTPLQCVKKLRGLLIAALTQMADAFGKVYVPCVVGNHGRTTRKPRMKGRIITSYEWNLYDQLEQYFKDIGDDRVSFTVASGTDVRFNVLGHWFLLTHGDSLGVKGGDGIIGAIGPIMRGVIKTLNAYAAINQQVDTVIMGHWHQELWLPRSITNNSLKGDDEFARLVLRAGHSRPSQLLWFVYLGYGIAHRTAVYCDETKMPKKLPPWLTVPAQ